MAVKNKNGFTIIEIIVTIAIIGILLSISVVSYGNWRQSAIITQIKNDLRNAATAFENYRNFNHTYPTSVSSLADFTTSDEITISGGSLDGLNYCIAGVSDVNLNLQYYISSAGSDILMGVCP